MAVSFSFDRALNIKDRAHMTNRLLQTSFINRKVLYISLSALAAALEAIAPSSQSLGLVLMKFAPESEAVPASGTSEWLASYRNKRVYLYEMS